MKYLCRKCNKKHTASDNANRFSHCTCSCGNTFRLFAADFRCSDFTNIKFLSNFFFPYPQSYCPYCSGLVNVGTTSNLLSDGSMRVPEICPFCHNALRALRQMDEESESHRSEVQKEDELYPWLDDWHRQDLIEKNKQIAAAKEKERLEAMDAIAKATKAAEAVKKMDEKELQERVINAMVLGLKNMTPQERIDFFKRLSEDAPQIDLRKEILKYSNGALYTPEEWTIFEKRGWISWYDLPKDLAESLAED